MSPRSILLLAAAALALGSPALSAAPSKPAYGEWGYDASAMDSSVKPGDDFFAYVNGSWFKRTEIAPDRTFAGIDSVLNDQIDKDVRDIVEDMAKDPDQSGRIGQQVGDFYASWMDEGGDRGRAACAAQALSRPNRRGEDRDGVWSICSRPSASPVADRASPSSPTSRTRPATRSSLSQSGLGLA